MRTSAGFRTFTVCTALFTSPLAAIDWASDVAEIRRSLAASVLAFNRGDLPGHLAIYDESVQFLTKNGPRPGIAPIEKAFREAYFKDAQVVKQLRFEELTLRSLTPDAALATARFSLTGGGKPDQAVQPIAQGPPILR